jgi:hypothetical protein
VHHVARLEREGGQVERRAQRAAPRAAEVGRALAAAPEGEVLALARAHHPLERAAGEAEVVVGAGAQGHGAGGGAEHGVARRELEGDARRQVGPRLEHDEAAAGGTGEAQDGGARRHRERDAPAGGAAPVGPAHGEGGTGGRPPAAGGRDGAGRGRAGQRRGVAQGGAHGGGVAGALDHERAADERGDAGRGVEGARRLGGVGGRRHGHPHPRQRVDRDCRRRRGRARRAAAAHHRALGRRPGPGERREGEPGDEGAGGRQHGPADRPADGVVPPGGRDARGEDARHGGRERGVGVAGRPVGEGDEGVAQLGGAGLDPERHARDRPGAPRTRPHDGGGAGRERRGGRPGAGRRAGRAGEGGRGRAGGRRP